MPVQVELITEIHEAVDMLYDTLQRAPSLALGYIGKNDEKRLPQYPAVVVSGGPRTKELHATHTFAVGLTVLLWVYHAKMSLDHRTRSQEDLELVAAIEAALEEDMTFGDRIIHGYIENEQPGVLQPKSQKGDLVVGTRMTWVGVTQKRF